jgi:serine/threonine-protein kinase
MNHEGSAGATARFLREAKIQARLEHPSIVPVHDLGVDAGGRPYFTMKRLAGTTLVDLLGRDTTLQRLLRVFVDVCNAIEFAHTRGVVHRDIKPSNIMAGNFGEVYVLDWGVARVLDERGPDAIHVRASTRDEIVTQAGVLVGTRGYMSPEQARGEEAGPEADVYSLGAVLFEILTREHLHPPGIAGVTSTLSEPTVSPAARTPGRGIAPELDSACLAALAAKPGDRPSARTLGNRVQQYLDGDRDLAQRRALAGEQLAVARDAVASGNPARRAEAIQAAGRALALDPESRDAAALVSGLILQPPAEPPQGLKDAVAATNLDLMMRQRRAAGISVGSYFFFLPIVLWMGIKDWVAITALFSMVAVVVLWAWSSIRRRSMAMTFALITHATLIAMMSRIAGPFVLVPILAGIGTMALIAAPVLIDRKWLVIGTMVCTVAVPTALERLGILSSTWAIEGGRLVMEARTVTFDSGPATVFLLASNLTIIMFAGLFAHTLASTRRDAILRAESQAWHLAQLLPRESLART